MIVTDHAPLQWLSAQKMQGLLCRWALVIQEYDFNIIYRKGSLNSNADALSRQQPTTCAITVEWPQQSLVALRQSQETDSTISKVLHARLSTATAPHIQQWKTYPFRRYKQLWSQLHVIDESSTAGTPQAR